MRFRKPRFWVDNFRGFNYHLTWQERRSLVLSRVENAGFGWWIVLVAGLGFLTDAYDIFAVNTMIPMLQIVYWGDNMRASYVTALNCATLVGSMIGMVVFGILADRYGRRKMYGLELIVTIAASLGSATASSGVNNSMNILGLLVFGRLIMGIGIGADYPLSSVITAEFAPTRYRARMLAVVFSCQPFGQLIATLMAFAATAGFRNYLSMRTDAGCSADIDCTRTLDRAWRLVAGLGTVPAAIAIVFRLTIPESVYYVLDIKNDTNEAMHVKEYFPPTKQDLRYDLDENIQLDNLPQDAGREIRDEENRGQAAGTHHYTLECALPAEPLGLGPSAQEVTEDPLTQPATEVVEPFENPHQIKASRQDFVKYLFSDGNWTDLFATSVTWMLLDFTFYLLGVNSTAFIPKMFGSQSELNGAPYPQLISYEKQLVESTSIGGVVGSLIAIVVMNHLSRKKIQMWGFLVLGCLFVVVGATYLTAKISHAYVATAIFYGFCHLFFSLGPNTTTFIIPAESFPTRYRCTCNGIAAASGKFGSVMGQVLVTKIADNRGPTLISFVAIMLVGAVITKYLTPETCDIRGRSRKLEDLAKGKSHRRKMEQDERDAEDPQRKRTL